MKPSRETGSASGGRPMRGAQESSAPATEAEAAPAAAGSTVAAQFSGMIALFAVVLVVWLSVNSSLAADVVLPGIAISAVVAAVFGRRSAVWQGIRLTPRALAGFIAYLGVFLVELVRSNLNMMRIVYSPRVAVRPGIVKVRTRLKSPVGRLALANSIALTPGSLVMEIDGETFYIHWLDVETTDIDAATRRIVGPFEKHLEAAFG